MLGNRNHYDILKEFYSGILSNIKFDSRVKLINYTNKNEITVFDEKGNKYNCLYVIIAVPIKILQDGDIKFVPKISNEMQKAISKVKMGRGGKIFFSFSKRFWDENGGLILIKGVLNYWRVTHPPKEHNKEELNMLTSMVTDKAYDLLETLTHDQIVDLILKDFERAFKNPNIKNYFKDMHYMNWSKDQNIKGVYTYTSMKEKDSRKMLDKSIDNRIFLCGEACHPSSEGTIHGAIETGYISAEKVKQKLLPKF